MYIHTIMTFPSSSYLPHKNKKNGAGCDSEGGSANGTKEDAIESRPSAPRKEASASAKAPRVEAAKGASKSA